MVRTVKILRVLSSIKEGQTSKEYADVNKTLESPKKCRFFIRVPSSDLGSVRNVPDAKQSSTPVNEKSKQGVDDQQSSSGNSMFVSSREMTAVGAPGGSGSKKSGLPTATPQRRRQAIVSLQNGGKGIIMNRLRQPAVALTSVTDTSKKHNEKKSGDGLNLSSQRYPPTEHTAHLLKLLSSGEILSYGELDEIVSYVNYLKSRKLVTDHLLKKKIISLISEPQGPSEPDTYDDEPPIIPSKVKLPFNVQKRHAAQTEETVPSKMPRLLEVLQSNDFPVGVDNVIRRRRTGLPRSKEAQVSCEMCGSRVQATHLKMHHKICKGVLIRRPRRAPDGSSCPPQEEQRTRACPRCGKVLSCDKDFEMHMAVAHKFYWRLEFDKEEEFKAWFREEGLDETMYIATCQTNADFQQKIYYCTINRNQMAAVRCPCRLVVKKVQSGIIVRYFVLHNHTERFVRRVMSVECRDMIIRLLKEGLSNYEILKKVKEAYPKTSMNHYVTRESITRLRYRYHRNTKTTRKTESRFRNFSAKSRRGKRAAGLEETGAHFPDDKQHEIWPLPELRCTEMNARNTYADVEDVDNCSVIDSANF